jgi:hypothetical protein
MSSTPFANPGIDELLIVNKDAMGYPISGGSG